MDRQFQADAHEVVAAIGMVDGAQIVAQLRLCGTLVRVELGVVQRRVEADARRPLVQLAAAAAPEGEDRCAARRSSCTGRRRSLPCARPQENSSQLT
jgi:hypothetical protein